MRVSDIFQSKLGDQITHPDEAGPHIRRQGFKLLVNSRIKCFNNPMHQSI